jgi:hypothetical protein
MLTELEYKREQRQVRGYDDEQLVFAMLAMPTGTRDRRGGFTIGEQTAHSAAFAPAACSRRPFRPFEQCAAGEWALMGSRDTRREQNQKLFRTGNERLNDLLDDELSEAALVPFLCECADEFCDGRVELTVAAWETIASKPNHFVMVAGHPRSEGEVVVGKLDGYDVVQKPK